MIDDDTPAAVPSDRLSLARTFDYLKHLTTLALVSIGGVLGLLQGEGPTLKPLVVVLVVAVLAFSGAIGVIMLSTIAALELKAEAVDVAKVRKGMVWMQRVATFSVLFGLGIFLGAFVGELNK